jgi:hypothetical protein
MPFLKIFFSTIVTVVMLSYIVSFFSIVSMYIMTGNVGITICSATNERISGK